MSEWQAWAIYKQQERWSLVIIAPGNALGPPVAATPVARALANSFVNSPLTAPTGEVVHWVYCCGVAL